MNKLFFLILMLSVFCLKLLAQSVIDLDKAIRNKPKVILLSEIASDIRYIPLETNDYCLIGAELSIALSGNDIIAADHQTRSFFRFDESGKYLNKIGNQGQGPGEYSVGLFFMTDPVNNDIFIQEFGDLMHYKKDGRFVKKTPAPNLNMGASEMLNNNFIVYTNNLYVENKKNPFQLYVIDKNGKEQNKWKGFIEKGKRYGLILSSRDFLYVYNGATYFKPALEEVVYKIESPKKKRIVWEFETGEKGMDVSTDETNAKNRNKSIFIRQVKETAKYLFVLYGLEQNVYLGMYDKQSESFNNVIIKDDLAGGFDFIHTGKCADNNLMSVILPVHAQELKRYNNATLANRKNELDALLKKMADDDNPIIVKVTLK